MTETRRRGSVLEQAILDAAWAELSAVGYADMTVASVAARAGTAKSVLYRRWADKAELVHAAIEQRTPVLEEPASTGDLRSDALTILNRLVVADVSIQMIAALDLDLSVRLRRATADRAAYQLFDALVAAGFDPAAIHPRILRLPVDLVAHDLALGISPVDAEEIVDEVFLPLLQAA